MMNDEKTISQRVAEKSPIASIVASVIGGVSGTCSAKVVTDAFECIMANDLTTPQKVVYGLGAYALGGFVGLKVTEYMTAKAQKVAGSLLILKAGAFEVSAVFPKQEPMQE